MADIEQQLLRQLGQAGSIADTGPFAEGLKVDHLAVVGVLKSLEAAEMITMEVMTMLPRASRVYSSQQ
jgi:hypothetical protein